MITVTTILGTTKITTSNISPAFMFADTSCIITAIYNISKERGFGENFKEVLTKAINDGTAFGENSKSVPPSVQDIIDKTIQGDKDE